MEALNGAQRRHPGARGPADLHRRLARHPAGQVAAACRSTVARRQIDGQPVPAGHRDELHGVLAVERRVGWHPQRRLRIALVLVGLTLTPPADWPGRWRTGSAARSASRRPPCPRPAPAARCGRSAPPRRSWRHGESRWWRWCTGRAACRSPRHRGSRLVHMYVLSTRSRLRMSSRVSHPLCPPGASVSSVQASPNAARR